MWLNYATQTSSSNILHLHSISMKINKLLRKLFASFKSISFFYPRLTIKDCWYGRNENWTFTKNKNSLKINLMHRSLFCSSNENKLQYNF